MPCTKTPTTLHFSWEFLSEVARGSLRSLRRNADALDHDALSGLAGDPDVDGLGSEPRRVLEVVVSLTLSLLPRLSGVGGDLERRNSNVGVLDLHAEPVGAGAGLVLEHNGRADAAGHEVPGDGDDALVKFRELGEAGCVQVEMVGSAAGALVHDHGGDLVAGGTGDGYTGSAVSSAVPVGTREGGAKKGGGDGVAGEGAGTMLDRVNKMR